MKIRVIPQELVKHISIAQRAISTRTTINILECILFKAENSQLILTSTDLELSIETRVPCEVIEEGSFVISSDLIGSIFRKLPAHEAVLEADNDVLNIDCLDSHFHLQVQNAKEYPPLIEIKDAKTTHIESDVLKRAVQETEFATSLDESKVALTGIYFERKEKEIRLVALDGYRLAVRVIPLSDDEDEYSHSVIIPRRAMIELTRIFPDNIEISIHIIQGHVVFESENTKLYSRLIDKNYIRYEEIISTDFKTEVIVNRQNLQNSFERASLLVKEERANLIKLTFEDDFLHIESNSEIGHVNEQIAVEKTGDNLKIAFNAKYLLDGIRSLNTEKVHLFLNGTLNPLVVKPLGDENSYLYLVLPVRVGRD